MFRYSRNRDESITTPRVRALLSLLGSARSPPDAHRRGTASWRLWRFSRGCRLWHLQRNVGYSRHERSFRASPYGFKWMQSPLIDTVPRSSGCFLESGHRVVGSACFVCEASTAGEYCIAGVRGEYCRRARCARRVLHVLFRVRACNSFQGPLRPRAHCESVVSPG